jgi:hypothetical protein
VARLVAAGILWGDPEARERAFGGDTLETVKVSKPGEPDCYAAAPARAASDPTEAEVRRFLAALVWLDALIFWAHLCPQAFADAASSFSPTHGASVQEERV